MARATATAAPTEPQPPTRRPVKIKVKLTRNSAGSYDIKSSHVVPNSEIVKAYMTKKSMPIFNQHFYRGINVNELINATVGRIRPKEWADAIAKATAQVLSQQQRVETEILAVEGGGYLAIGNALFQLSVVDYIEHGPKALRVVRQQTLDTAKLEGDGIIAAATQKAEEVRVKGDTYYREQIMKGQELIRQQEALRQQLVSIAPEWCRTYRIPTCVKNGRLYVGLFPKIKIDFFEWQFGDKRGRIAAAVAPPVTVLIWAPIEEFYTNSMFIEDVFGALPHMSSSGCVEIGDAPKSLTSIDSLTRLRQSVQRAFSIMNMDSPLTVVRQWSDDIKAFIPEKLKPVFNFWYDRGDITYLLTKHRIQPDDLPPAPGENAHVFTVVP